MLDLMTQMAIWTLKGFAYATSGSDAAPAADVVTETTSVSFSKALPANRSRIVSVPKVIDKDDDAYQTLTELAADCTANSFPASS